MVCPKRQVDMIGEIDMIRADMISTVGREYLTSNIENDEYSYPKALPLRPFLQ